MVYLELYPQFQEGFTVGFQAKVVSPLLYLDNPMIFGLYATY